MLTSDAMRNSLPAIVAHRGASGIATENSLAAFRAAIALGADGVELDVHAAADGTIIVHHDFVLPGLGPIRDLTASSLAAYRLPNGEPLPTLAAALEVLPAVDAYIEVKALPPEHDAALLAALGGAAGPRRIQLHSFDHRIVHRLAPKARCPIGVLQASYPLDPAAVVRATGAAALWQEAHLIDQALVDAVHAAGARVIAWTVNDPALARRLARLGVDALCGNWPDQLRSAVGSV